MPGMPGRAPAPPPKADHHEEHKAHEAHCPGHGPLDPPGHINWWKGLLWVDNVRSQQPGLNQLLFRYENQLDHCDPKNTPPPFLAAILNFGIFGFVLYRFGKKPLVEGLKRRKQQIMADIETATRLREAAEDRLADIEEKIDRLEDTAEELRKELRAQAQAERAAVLAEAEQKKARLVKDAEARVEQELAAAQDAIVKEALLEALAAAEELIAKKATPADQERILREHLAGVGKALGKGAA